MKRRNVGVALLCLGVASMVVGVVGAAARGSAVGDEIAWASTFFTVCVVPVVAAWSAFSVLVHPRDVGVIAGVWTASGGGPTAWFNRSPRSLTGLLLRRSRDEDAYGPETPRSLRHEAEYFPIYQPVDEQQTDLAAALADVHEPITVAQAQTMSCALGVRVELRDLRDALVCVVEPNGTAHTARRA